MDVFAAASRRTVLVVALIGAVPAFAGTHALVGMAHGLRDRLATEAAERGARELANGRAADAADDFRTAMEYSLARDRYRLPLAQALIAANRPLEARAQLQTLWTEQPGDGLVNLELGRLAAAAGDLTTATRYYHAAIDGAWESEAARERRSARLELARLLVDRGAALPAQAELIGLAGDLPDDARFTTDVGELLSRAGADGRALTVLQRALQLDPSDARAARLAGLAAFRTGDFATTRRYLEEASRLAPLDAGAARTLEVADRVLVVDPYARHVSSRERLRRVLRAFATVGAWLARCNSDQLGDIRSTFEALRPSANEAALARDPDKLDEITTAVTAADAAVTPLCPPVSVDEQAVDLVLRQRRIG